jgi:hypothetical protein
VQWALAVTRFALVLVLFHLVVLAASLALARAYARRVAERRQPAWGSLLAGGALLAAVVLLGALAGGALYDPRTRFTVLRLVSQALFGELPLLGAWLAGLLFRHGLRRAGLTLALLPAALVGLYWRAYHVEPQALVERTHTLALPRGDGARTLRIAHLSDLQTGAPGAHEARALRAALALRPDLVVLTGDYVQPLLGGRLTLEQAEAALRELIVREGLRATLGVFAVPGDVEHAWPRPLDGLGITCLADQVAQVPLEHGRTLAIVGLALPTSRGRAAGTLLGLARAAARADYRIALGHRPDFVKQLAPARLVDLALAGHTHGGQVVLPFLGPPLTLISLPRRFAGDLNDYAGLPLHVSRGVGMERGTAPQLRFLCPPEVCLVELRL